MHVPDADGKILSLKILAQKEFKSHILAVYCNLPALGMDQAYIIIMCPLSSIYAQSLMSATGHTSSKFTPGYLWPIRSTPHGLLSSWSSCQGPHVQLYQLFCQDSMHGGTPSGIQVLIGKWVPLGHHWLGIHAMLHMSSTWSSHPNTTIHMMNLWKAVVHLQG